MRYEWVEHAAHAEVRVEGLVSLAAWETMLTSLHADLAKRPRGKLLLDLFGLLGFLGEADRRAVGALFAAQLGGLERVAIAIDAQKITGVVEAEARRLGLELRLFAGRAQALEWLLG